MGQKKNDTLADVGLGRLVEKIAGRQFRPLYSRGGWTPAVDCSEDDANFYIVVALAGVCPQAIDVQPHDDVLTISGTRPSPSICDPQGSVRVHAMEIDHGRFTRDLPIPDQADIEAVSAVYEQGLLWITLPKKAGGGR